MERQTPKPHEVYRHFKGHLYEIIAVGHHSETKERMVVYYDLSGKNSTLDDPCIRPLDMFMSEVDRNKYPDADQKYRLAPNQASSGISAAPKSPILYV